MGFDLIDFQCITSALSRHCYLMVSDQENKILRENITDNICVLHIPVLSPNKSLIMNLSYSNINSEYEHTRRKKNEINHFLIICNEFHV